MQSQSLLPDYFLITQRTFTDLHNHKTKQLSKRCSQILHFQTFRGTPGQQYYNKLCKSVLVNKQN